MIRELSFALPPRDQQALISRPFIKGLPITATTVSRHPNGDHYEETIRPTYEDYYTIQFKQLHACMVDGAPVKTDVRDCESLSSGYVHTYKPNRNLTSHL